MSCYTVECPTQPHRQVYVHHTIEIAHTIKIAYTIQKITYTVNSTHNKLHTLYVKIPREKFTSSVLFNAKCELHRGMTVKCVNLIIKK